MRLIEPQVRQQIIGVLELRRCLSGESDDDIGGNGDIGNDLADARHQPLIVGDGIAAAHLRQNLVVPRLNGNLDVRADLRQIRDCVEQIVLHPIGMAGQEANALQTLNLVDGMQECDEGRLRGP